MTLQVLVSTMNQRDYSLLDKMNIQSDAIVVNQCDRNEICEFDYKGHKIKWMNLAERGVGLSRNTALMRATADIVLFADDDVVYENNYVKKVLSSFERYTKAGLIIFNLNKILSEKSSSIAKYGSPVNKTIKKLNYFNCLKYGACRIAVKREKVIRKNIFFSLLFGGGAKYQSGEDCKFITDCIKANILCITSTHFLGSVYYGESSWFSGLDKKYYTDKGALFADLFGKYAKTVLFLFELKNNKKNKDSKNSFINKLRYEFTGIKNFNGK